MEKIRISNSKLTTFLHCRKKYEWIYEEQLVPRDSSLPLQVGSVIHDLIHLYYTNKLTLDKIKELPNIISTLYPTNTTELTEAVVTESARLMAGYIEKWKDPNANAHKVISSEYWLELEMDDPDCILFGKVDRLYRGVDGKLWRGETKTTSRMDSAYLSGLKSGLQSAIYDFLIDHLMSEAVTGTIYDLIVKTKVPQYYQVPSHRNLTMRERMLKCLKGVVKDIKAKDYYPSCDCFLYNSVCPYKTLCDGDSKEAREAFYTKRISPADALPEDKQIIKLNTNTEKNAVAFSI